jgi:hypothetical protein
MFCNACLSSAFKPGKEDRLDSFKGEDKSTPSGKVV